MIVKNLREGFASPDPDFGPVPFWWWSAEEVTEERVRWQLQKFRSGGLRNIGILNIAPTGPQYGSVADDPPYFSERWWTMFEVAVSEAKRLGMRIFFYDQIGFSGSNFPARLVAEQPELAGYQLRRLVQGEELPAGAELLLEYGSYCYITVRQGFNWLDRRATELLYDRIYGEFERRFPDELGKTIAGSFQDELPSMPLWTKGIVKLYALRYREDLITSLPALFEDVEGAPLIRRRVYELATELAEEAVFKLQFDWHKRHHMLQCCDQAGPARRADLHGAQRLYLDYMRTHRWYNAAGCDMDGEIKPHASMVHLHGGKRVFLESFHTSGWGGTMEETMHWLVPWLQAGVTLYSPHSVYYSTRGGWWEWAPPDTGWRQPYYEHYEVFADTVSRACWLLTQGTHIADVAVHYPSHAACGWMSLSDGGPLEHPMVVANMMPHERLEHVQEVYQSLTGRWNRKEGNKPGALRSACIDFDVTDDSALELAEQSEGKLRIGEESFSVLLLCGTTIMDDAAQAKVKAWIEAGGLVIAVQCGDEDPVLEGAVYVNSPQEAINLIGSKLPGRAIGPNMPLMRRIEDADLFLLLPEAGELLPMHEPSGERLRPPRSARYRLRTKGYPQLWDPVSGQVQPLSFSRDGDWVELEVPFDSWPAAFVVCPWEQADAEGFSYTTIATDRLAPSEKVPAFHGGQEPVMELHDWQVLAVATLDNRYGDFDLHGARTDFVPIERREFLVAREVCETDGVASNWHESDFDDSGWMKRLWSEAAYWECSRNQRFEEGSVFPIIYSNTLGDMSFRTWAGRMGRIPRKFLNLGMAVAGDKVWARTIVIAPEAGTYWLRIESNAAITSWVNGERIELVGGPEEQTSEVKLKSGANSLLLCAEALAEGLIRAGVTCCANAQEPLPKWIYSGSPNPKTRLLYTISEQGSGTVSRVRVIFCAKGRVALYVNGNHMTEHGDFNPYIRQGQEELDVTPYWCAGNNDIELVMPEGEGVAMVDGVVEFADGSSDRFCTGPAWMNESGQQSEVLHEAVLQFAETETMWLAGRKHPLSNVDWLMPDAKPTSRPLPFVRENDQTGKPIWLRFPLPAGATALQISSSGECECWISGRRKKMRDGRAGFDPQPAGTMAVLRIMPNDMSTEADVLLEPIRFEAAPVQGELGDWRSALCLPHHSGVIEYETKFEWKEEDGAVLELGDVRGTAEVWLNGQRLGVRIWSPFRFRLEVGTGSHHLRIRVTNTLGAHYEIGRPSSNVGGSMNPKVSYWQPDTMSEQWESSFAAGGLFGPVRLYASN
jgi:hypothetical protein